MTYLKNGRNFIHTQGDTFDVVFNSDAEFNVGSTALFVISANETTTPEITKLYNVAGLQIPVKLTASETASLNLADYLWKLTITDGNTITLLSGEFNVVWGDGYGD